MADVSTYSRCTMPHWSLNFMHAEGEVRASGDPAVTQNPQWWVPLSDAVMSNGNIEVDL